MKKFSILILAFIISSCATSYHHKNFYGGYTDFQMEENVFKVSFKGNSKTTMERAVDFSLLRSAEISLQNGYKYFVILGRNQFVDEDWHYSYHYYPYITEKPRVYFTIKCFNEKPEGKVYNAKLIKQSLMKKYRLEEEKIASL